jgi:hypothetical protein
MDIVMTNEPLLSPIRRILCSHARAMRVAAQMRADGAAAHVVATRDPLQPWRAIELAENEDREVTACA